METVLVYLDTILIFALGALVASALAKATLALKTADELRATLPNDKRIDERAGAAAQALIPGMVEKLLESQKIKKQIARAVEEECTRGSVAVAMRDAIEKQCRELARYLEKEIVPKVVNEESRKIFALPRAAAV